MSPNHKANGMISAPNDTPALADRPAPAAGGGGTSAGCAAALAPPSAVARAGPSTLSIIQALGARAGTGAAAAAVEPMSIDNVAATIANLLPVRIFSSVILALDACIAGSLGETQASARL